MNNLISLDGKIGIIGKEIIKMLRKIKLFLLLKND
jgi:hypothetical protein